MAEVLQAMDRYIMFIITITQLPRQGYDVQINPYIFHRHFRSPFAVDLRVDPSISTMRHHPAHARMLHRSGYEQWLASFSPAYPAPAPAPAPARGPGFNYGYNPPGDTTPPATAWFSSAFGAAFVQTLMVESQRRFPGLDIRMNLTSDNLFRLDLGRDSILFPSTFPGDWLVSTCLPADYTVNNLAPQEASRLVQAIDI